MAPESLVGLDIPATIAGFDEAAGSVTADRLAPAGGLTIQFSSSHPGRIAVASSTQIAEGDTSAMFTLRTRPTGGYGPSTITASLGESTLAQRVEHTCERN